MSPRTFGASRVTARPVVLVRQFQIIGPDRTDPDYVVPIISTDINRRTMGAAARTDLRHDMGGLKPPFPGI
jgi:hypothetical protein